ncbi:MAG: class I adenylate-forming enzyme family protein [Cumulibacter sp.]
MHDTTWPLAGILPYAARRFPKNRCFLDQDGHSRTFAEVHERVNRLANSLRDAGVEKGTRIALLDTDSMEYAEVLLACFTLGATYVPVNYRLATPEITNILGRAQPSWLFVGQRYLAQGREVIDGFDFDCQIASLDGCTDIDVEGLIAQGSPFEVVVTVYDEDPVGIMFTSGTTGLPKGVVQSQGMQKRSMSMGWETYPRPGDVRYTASPMFHIAGWAIVFCQIATGATSLIVPQFDAQVTARAIRDGVLNGCFLVPTMMQAVLEQDDAPSGLEKLDTILYGSAPMPPSLLRRALQRWPECNFWNMFGAGTESGLQTLLRPEDHRRALAGEDHLLASAGQPVLGVDLRILDDEGNPVPTGTVGNIAAKTDCVMDGYLDMPEKTREALHDEWFWGGDRGYFDAEGYLYLGGRSRDMIIRGGENIYVAEIEIVLTDWPTVIDAAVVGREDGKWGEVVIAFVEHEGEPPTADELRELCRSRLASYKVPVEYHVLDRLPRNPTGKVRKNELVESLT